MVRSASLFQVKHTRYLVTSCVDLPDDSQIVDVMSGQEIGVISKQWPGLIKNMFTDSDNFRVTCKLKTYKEHVDGPQSHL